MQVRDLIEELKRFPATANVKMEIFNDGELYAAEIERVNSEQGEPVIIAEEE